MTYPDVRGKGRNIMRSWKTENMDVGSSRQHDSVQGPELGLLPGT